MSLAARLRKLEARAPGAPPFREETVEDTIAWVEWCLAQPLRPADERRAEAEAVLADPKAGPNAKLVARWTMEELGKAPSPDPARELHN